MSTRGALGFRVGGVDKVTYVHDSADDLAVDVVNWAKTVTDWKYVKRAAMAMKRVTASPTEDQILDVSIVLGIEPKAGLSWYQLLRPAQGNPWLTLDAKWYEDKKRFLYNSLFCEHACIINLDMMELEVYVGMQKVKHDKGRYSLKKGDGKYFPVALDRRIDLLKVR